MALLHGPLLSITAAGSLGAVTYRTRSHQRADALQKHSPINPRSARMTAQRHTVDWLGQSWQALPAEIRAPYHQSASALKLNGWSLYWKTNGRGLFREDGLELYRAGPAARTSFPTPSVAVTPSPNHVLARYDSIEIPPGWTPLGARYTAIPQQHPHTGQLTPPVITGLSTSPLQGISIDLPHGGSWSISTYIFYRDAHGALQHGNSTNGIIAVP